MYSTIKTGDVRLPIRQSNVEILDRQAVLKDILRREGMVTRHKRGDYLYRTGDRFDRIYMLTDGLVALTRVCRSGSRQVLDFAFKGAILPEARNKKNRVDHSVEVLADTVSCVMSISSFARCVKEEPAAQDALQAQLAQSVSRAYDHLTNMGCRQGGKRLSYILAELHHRARQAGADADDGIPVRQVDLADAAGITTVYVNQMLKKLEADKIVGLQKGSIRIFDSAELLSRSGFDAGQFE